MGSSCICVLFFCGLTCRLASVLDMVPPRVAIRKFEARGLLTR